MTISWFTFTPPLAVLPEYPAVGESLLYQVTGLTVVLLALSSIWFLLEIIGVFFKRADARAAAAGARPVAAAPAAGPAAALPHAGGLDPELIAAIAAAVHVTVGSGHRIHSVTPAQTLVDWAREGRREIFASHKLR